MTKPKVITGDITDCVVRVYDDENKEPLYVQVGSLLETIMLSTIKAMEAKGVKGKAPKRPKAKKGPS